MTSRSKDAADEGEVPDWEEIDFTKDPRLLAGWRIRRRLDAHRFRLERAVFDELRALCEPTVQYLGTAERRDYEQFAALEGGEQFFSYDISAFPVHPPTQAPPVDQPGSPEDDTADLVRLVRTVDALPAITRADMDEGGYTFYAICWPHGGTMVGFVTKTDPMTTLRPGFRYFQFGDALRTADKPDLALKEGADIFVGATQLAILRPSAFNILLGDVDVLREGVSDDIKKLQAALQGSIPLTGTAADAVREEGQRLISYARRLRVLPDRFASMSGLDTTALVNSMQAHGVAPELLLDTQGQFSFGVAQVELFLDVVEGRYFEDDLGKERRRADRFSQRK